MNIVVGIIKVYKMGELSCPYCSAVLRASAHIAGGRNDTRPEPGMLTVCAQCAKTSQYIADGLLLKLAPFDKNKLTREQRATIERVEAMLAQDPPPDDRKAT